MLSLLFDARRTVEVLALARFEPLLGQFFGLVMMRAALITRLCRIRLDPHNCRPSRARHVAGVLARVLQRALGATIRGCGSGKWLHRPYWSTHAGVMRLLQAYANARVDALIQKIRLAFWPH
jgi:hypothetical protein